MNGRSDKVSGAHLASPRGAIGDAPDLGSGFCRFESCRGYNWQGIYPVNSQTWASASGGLIPCETCAGSPTVEATVPNTVQWGFESLAAHVKRWMEKLKRWLTLADVPTISTRPKCDDCDAPATYFISVFISGNQVSEQFCEAHKRFWWDQVPE